MNVSVVSVHESVHVSPCALVHALFHVGVHVCAFEYVSKLMSVDMYA